MGDESIIDLAEWVRARESESEDPVSPLALHGVTGERRRYVLPLWRMAYLAQARWAGLLRESSTGIEAVVVLDLRQDPPRTEPPGGIRPLGPSDRPPGIRVLGEGDLQLPLGQTPDGSRWCVTISDRQRSVQPEAPDREDLLFLAGECAGLLSMLEGET
jgi:hypothetical protein